jgi:hypothetical protein
MFINANWNIASSHCISALSISISKVNIYIVSWMCVRVTLGISSERWLDVHREMAGDPGGVDRSERSVTVRARYHTRWGLALYNARQL